MSEELSDGGAARLRSPWRELLIALGGGLLLAAAFPKVGLAPLVWVGLIPLLAILPGASPATALLAGSVYGIAWRAGTLYWVVYAMTEFGGLSWPLAVLAAAGLVGYLALYQGVFAVAVSRLDPVSPETPLVVAATWTGLEVVQAWLFSGFPWVLLGYPAGAGGLLVQAADLAGVYGLGFLVVAVNAGLLAMLYGERKGLTAATIPVLLLLVCAGYGGLRLATAPAAASEEGDALEVALVQGNVAQSQKWDAASREAIIDRHLELTARAAAGGADLVLWPESSWPDPYGIERNRVAAERVGSIADREGAAVLVGTVHVDDSGDEVGVANAAVLYGADGQWRGRYEKRHLVPFGEYLPLRDLLDFLGPLVEAVGEMRPGPEDQELLRAPDAGVPPFGLSICYEIIFPRIVRGQVRQGATFLATITNDAWYGTTSAPYQHFAMARLRAVENRRWLVRAANTGVSGVIDPWGRVRVRTGLFEEALAEATIAPRTDLTLYARTGDAFAYACLIVAVFAAVVRRR